MPNPSIAVVVPAYNEEAHIRACVEALAAHDYELSEIIIVDNSSTDGTAQILAELAARNPKIRVVQEPVPGVIAARNAGFDCASADIIARVDADTLVRDGWARAISEYFTHAPAAVAAITGPFDQHDMPFPSFHQAILDSVYRPHDLDPEAPSFLFNRVLGPNMAIRRSAWQQIRSHLTIGYHLIEDYDFSRAIEKAGFGIAVVRGMKVSVSGRRMLTSPVAYWKFTREAPRTVRLHHGVGKEYFSAIVGANIMRAVHLVLLLPGRSYCPETQSFDLARLLRPGGFKRVSATGAKR